MFHVMTKNNSAGHSVLTYFLKSVLSPVEACGSFDRLPVDNSTLSQNFNKWGEGGNVSEISEWGSVYNRGEMRLYRNVSVWTVERKSFLFRPPFDFGSDDQANASTISQGDIWEVYARAR